VTRGQAYVMVAVATTLWGLNGVISKVVLNHGISPAELTECRMLGAFAGLAAVLLATRPDTLRVARREWPELIALGLIGLVGVQLLYLVALRTLPVGISVLIEYLAPVLVALYAWLWLGRHVGRGLWAAIGLVILGLGLMVNVLSGGGLDARGVAAALLCACAYAFYIIVTERGIARRPAVATICIGFGVGSVFWVFAAPWWNFPWSRMPDAVSLDGRLEAWHLPLGLLIACVVVLGTLVPFALLVSSLHALPAARVTLLSTWEPVAGGLIAWVWLGQSLTASQLAGAGLVLAGILVAEGLVGGEPHA
jgi:drug/metabolite transporter (DMT)-like permease